MSHTNKGTVIAIFISPVARAPMQEIQEIEAIAGTGLKGDRYCTGDGSYNKQKPGKRQVTLINQIFFKDSGFEYIESRRNLVTLGVELMDLIGKEFTVGSAKFKGVKYCDTCRIPNELVGKKKEFKEPFFDRGGLIAEILVGGIIKVNDLIIPPPKNY